MNDITLHKDELVWSEQTRHNWWQLRVIN